MRIDTFLIQSVAAEAARSALDKITSDLMDEVLALGGKVVWQDHDYVHFEIPEGKVEAFNSLRERHALKTPDETP